MIDFKVAPACALRVALISEHASPAALMGGEDAGGQNVYVDEISRQLGQMGHRVDIFTRLDNPGTPQIQEWAPGVRIINVSAGPAKFLAKDSLWRFMPEFRDECIRFMLGSDSRYDIIHANFWMSGWVACELRRELHIPAVQIFHALGATKRRQQGDSDTSPPERINIERAITRQVDRVIATCPHERDELTSDYQMAPVQIEMIPLGVDCATFNPISKDVARSRAGLTVRPEDNVIVYVGRITRRKDVRNILDALSILEQIDRSFAERCVLVVVGGESRDPDPALTPELGALQVLADELQLSSRVIFTGSRTRDELRDYYSAGDVVVTTPWYEPFGLTPLEAMACGRPVLGSNVGGIGFTVLHGRTGILVPPREPVHLARALRDLLADWRRLSALGVAGRHRVERMFTWPVVAANTETLYRDVIRNANKGGASLSLQLTVPERVPAFHARK